MSTAGKAILLLGATATLACSSQPVMSMRVDIRTESNVDTSGINGITLYLFPTECNVGAGCDQLLKMAAWPRSGPLVAFAQTRAQPGQYVHIDPGRLGSGCALLYVEAYTTPAFPGQVLAAGCTDVTVPMNGSAAVMIDMISVTDGDKDGWIGQFNFPDGTHSQGPDCNDNDNTIFPGAAEPECSGDRNCTGMPAPCNRECQSNADCANKPNNLHCCSFDAAPNPWTCIACPVSTCAESSECITAGMRCCGHASTTCGAPPSPPMLCNCATTGECATISPTQCCISNQNTAGDLTPGTCYDSNLWLQTHPMATGFFTEWCRCETSQQCANLFPTLVAQGLCCVSDRMVCDAPRTGETCR